MINANCLQFVSGRSHRAAEACAKAHSSTGSVLVYFRVRASSLGVYLLFALSSLRERLSCFLRLPPLPLHGYPCGLLPPYPAPSIPLSLLLHATNRETARSAVHIVREKLTHVVGHCYGGSAANRCRPIITTTTYVIKCTAGGVAISCYGIPRQRSAYT